MRLPRASGVLLHPTCLPGPHGSGDLGPHAHHFVDWLVSAGQTLWQVLPLTGIGPGNSPYMSNSAFAGNPLLIDLTELQREGWLDAADLEPTAHLQHARLDFAAVHPFRMERLAKAARRFAAAGSAAQREDFGRFRHEQADWLGDYALFMSLAERFEWKDWWLWDPPLARRAASALDAARRAHAERIAFWEFCQWRFFRQWAALKAYANGKGVRIIGDAPIYIAALSAEVWARPELFELDATLQPTVVAGVPPDYFSTTGQRWGNPLYRWAEHEREGFAWWVQRVRRAFELMDILRIDHFRGFAGYWEVPASEATAVRGRWCPGPGEALFDALARALGELPIIAEDLGVITPDVVALRRKYDFPGMCILQFAFDADATNPYLPHHHEHERVVYTGTHDNDTTAGWWDKASEREKHLARAYLDTDGREMPWTLIRSAMASVADTAVIPLQDVLTLPSDCRMNYPGEPNGWWSWRFEWGQLQPWHAQRLREFVTLYGRAPA
ncbi:MAG: 4-alpha-glucanotransferase [Proteobacteria bacterium]|nr:4-alpha-glucanotransferase [Pseudomonadota bacterium]HOL37777.1 4-alpha-glucanotransferase [Rubrivivax sp.]